MAKKIVLVFPVPRAPSGAAGQMVGRIPFSLLYLERALRGAYEVQIFDQRSADFSQERLAKAAKGAVCVGVTVFTGYQITSGLALSRKLKLEAPGTPVVWGGWHATLDPKQVIAEESVDYAVVGQGETTLRELADCLSGSGGELSAVRGLVYKKDGEIRQNPPRAMVNPDSFPRADLGLLDCSLYFFKSEFAEKCAGLFASHGCPFHCSFCSVHQAYGRRWFPRDASNVLDEMALLKEKYGIDGVNFDDDNFFVDKNYTIKLLNGMIDRKLGIKWSALAHSSTFLKMADEPFLELLKKSGCSQIQIGAETGNQKILEEVIGKHAVVEDTYKFVELLKRMDIAPMLSTMVGFPYGDGSDYKDTFSMIAKCKRISSSLRPQVFLYTPYPGTVLYSYAIEHGFKPPQDLEGWGGHSLTSFKSPWVSDKTRRFLRNFNCCYAYYGNIDSVFFDKNPVKILVKGTLWLLANLRFRLNYFGFQIDAEAVYLAVRLLDKCGLVDIADTPWADI